MKNNPNKKLLPLAVLAALAIHSGTSEAVHVSPSGAGQVLIFPYYTVHGGYNTLINVTNTQANTKAVKVRFLEGKNSREVLDFNLFIAPNDVWTGAVVATASGARLITNDNSCVLPTDLFTETRTDSQGLAPNEFKNTQYTGAMTDSAVFATLDRTREGYFEVIEMGVIDPTSSPTAALVTAYIKHNSAGAPANCAALNSLEPTPGNTNQFRFPNVGAQLMTPPQGGLSGRASLVNAATGANFTFRPTALDGWSNAINYTTAGSLGPSLGDASPRTSMVMTPEGAVISNWASGRDAVSAALMRYTISNEFILDIGTASRTDWIVTFPTKRLYVDAVAALPSPAAAPFANNFPNAATGSCDAHSVSVFNREAQAPGSSQPIGGSGLPQPGIVTQGAALCWSANVVPFAFTNIVAARNANFLTLGAQTFVNSSVSTPSQSATPALQVTQGPNGHYYMQFDGNGAKSPPSGNASLLPISATLTPTGGASRPIPGRTYGLPAIGFMLHTYQNAGLQSSYGGVIEHNFTSRIE